MRPRERSSSSVEIRRSAIRRVAGCFVARLGCWRRTRLPSACKNSARQAVTASEAASTFPILNYPYTIQQPGLRNSIWVVLGQREPWIGETSRLRGGWCWPCELHSVPHVRYWLVARRDVKAAYGPRHRLSAQIRPTVAYWLAGDRVRPGCLESTLSQAGRRVESARPDVTVGRWNAQALILDTFRCPPPNIAPRRPRSHRQLTNT